MGQEKLVNNIHKLKTHLMKNLMYYKNYYGSVHFDDKELIFYGKIQFIKALVSYEAINANVLLEAFEKAVDDYLELCRNQVEAICSKVPSLVN